jgi:hypothetical protein
LGALGAKASWSTPREFRETLDQQNCSLILGQTQASTNKERERLTFDEEKEKSEKKRGMRVLNNAAKGEGASSRRRCVLSCC